jgi:hypothetical protein
MSELKWRRSCLVLVGLIVLTTATTSVKAQFGGLGRATDKLKVPDLFGRPPITTGLSDAKWGDPSKDGFTPAEAPRSLMTLKRTPDGGFVLEPGYFVEELQSYCLMAGTYGPGGGDGYLYAPVKGPADDAVVSILHNSVRHPDIEQQDIQMLLWAVVARARFEDLAPRSKAIAARLLSPRELAMLNRSALGVATEGAVASALGGVPEPLRQIAHAEARLRQMLGNPDATFADMEGVAVLTGAAPLGQRSEPVPMTRWSLHPDGYYVRYLPSAYGMTRVELWVPQGTPGVREFDPARHIAVPGNSSRQRLVQSARGASHGASK